MSLVFFWLSTVSASAQEHTPQKSSALWHGLEEHGQPREAGGDRGCPSSHAMEAEEVPLELSFARSLFQEGYYYQAVIEFERFLFRYPSHPLAGEAELTIGRCYQEGKQYRKAIEQYRKIEDRFAGTDLAVEASFRIGQTAYQAGEYEQTIISFRHFLDTFPRDRRSPEATYRTGWAHVHLHEFVQAREVFATLGDWPDRDEATPYEEASKAMVHGLTLIGELKERSPVVAGLLSAVLPGAGQMYAGAYKDGLLAFLVNGAFIAGAYEAFDKRVYVAGGLVSVVGLGFYSGSVYGAVNSTYHTNKEHIEVILRPLRKNYEFIKQSTHALGERDNGK